MGVYLRVVEKIQVSLKSYCFTPVEVKSVFFSGWSFYDNKSFGLVGHYTTEEMVVNDIATHYTDYPMGRDFFHSLYRMHSDALADGSQKAIDKIFGPEESFDSTTTSGDNGSDDKDQVFFWKVLALVACSLLSIVVAVLVCLLCNSFTDHGLIYYRRSSDTKGIETKNVIYA